MQYKTSYPRKTKEQFLVKLEVKKNEGKVKISWVSETSIDHSKEPISIYPEINAKLGYTRSKDSYSTPNVNCFDKYRYTPILSSRLIFNCNYVGADGISYSSFHKSATDDFIYKHKLSYGF